LLKLPTYLASPVIPSTIIWMRETLGHVAIDRNTNREFSGVVVGHVDPQKLNCSPDGNHVSDKVELEKAKFHLQLTRPLETGFAEDFDRAVENVEKIQAKIASSPNRRNIILKEIEGKFLRFTTNMFEKRIPRIDDETARWPISEKYSDAFEGIKHNYQVLPLCLYHGNTFIEPKDANKELKQALVEIYFSLKHYYMKKDHFNSFQAVIQQINILKADESTTKSVYKR
ncbi:hypothetical protein BD769DRAFT_1306517, partial [Suillus cothurnatus]